jgi:putative tricarboxylic transport membrane protein
LRKDLIGSAVLFLIAGAYYFASTDIPATSLEDEVGPRGFPTMLAALLALISVALAARALLVPAPVQVAASDDKDDEAPPLRALGLIAVGALYIPLAWLFGYVPAIVLLLVGVMAYEGLRPSWRSLSVAALGALFFWLLFVVLLGVAQPEALLF